MNKSKYLDKISVVTKFQISTFYAKKLTIKHNLQYIINLTKESLQILLNPFLNRGFHQV